jgi:hypothetical protein
MTAWFLKLIAKLGLSAVPGGSIIASFLSGASAVFGFLFEQISKAFADCLKNPRVFIVIGIALAAGNWYGWGNGYQQGKGDLETYKQEAIVYQRQADETAAAAKVAKESAMKAEAAKIASEKAKAEADKKAAVAQAEAAAQKAEADKVKATVKASAKVKSVARRARKATTDAWSDITSQIMRALGA